MQFINQCNLIFFLIITPRIALHTLYYYQICLIIQIQKQLHISGNVYNAKFTNSQAIHHNQGYL